MTSDRWLRLFSALAQAARRVIFFFSVFMSDPDYSAFSDAVDTYFLPPLVFQTAGSRQTVPLFLLCSREARSLLRRLANDRTESVWKEWLPSCHGPARVRRCVPGQTAESHRSAPSVF